MAGTHRPLIGLASVFAGVTMLGVPVWSGNPSPVARCLRVTVYTAFPGTWVAAATFVPPDRHQWSIHTAARPVRLSLEGGELRTHVGNDLVASEPAATSALAAMMRLEALPFAPRGPGIPGLEVETAPRGDVRSARLQAVISPDLGGMFRVRWTKYRAIDGVRIPHLALWRLDDVPFAVVRVRPLSGDCAADRASQARIKAERGGGRRLRSSAGNAVRLAPGGQPALNAATRRNTGS